MNLPSFQYFEPRSVKEASRLLRQGKGRGKILAGGTDLLNLMRMRSETPSFLVNLGALKELSFIRYDKAGGLRIGALTSLAAISESAEVRVRCPMLAQAAEKIASPQMRNAATLGGNILLDTKCPYYNQTPLWFESGIRCLKAGGDECLAVKGEKNCYAFWSSDTVPPLIALGARVKIVTGEKGHWLNLDKLYTGLGDKPVKIAADEILTEVLIPASSCHMKGAYLRFSQREAIDFPVVSVAVAAAVSRQGKISRLRIVAGGVDSAPKRLLKAEGLLRGKIVDGALAPAAAAMAAREVAPIKDVFYPSRFKRDVLRALVEDGILACMSGEKAG